MKSTKRIVWTQTMNNVLESGVRRKLPLKQLATKLGVSRTTIHNRIQTLRGKTLTKTTTTTPTKTVVKKPAETLTGNVTLVHNNFTMTSKGKNITITLNQ